MMDAAVEAVEPGSKAAAAGCRSEKAAAVDWRCNLCCSGSAGPSSAIAAVQDSRSRRSLVWGLATGSLGQAEAYCCSGRRGARSAPAAVVEAWVCCTELLEVGGCCL